MKSTELQTLIEEAIKDFDSDSFGDEIGKVISVYDGIVIASGLYNVEFEELVEFQSGIKGIVFNLDTETISIVVIGDYSKIRSGEIIKRMRFPFSIPINENMIGRVLNGYGETIDGQLNIKGQYYPVDNAPVPMFNRTAVKRQLLTGIRIIDWLTPLGLGQRQLILGNRVSGKTSIAIDTMISLKNDPNIVSIYVSIGQKNSNMTTVIHELKKADVKNAIIIIASGSDPVSMRYLAPFVGTRIAEYFRDLGKDAIVFFDDLGAHAITYRELSLILKRPPGRDAFPGDIFFLHSRLLERAAPLNKRKGFGSVTHLPIIEILDDDISGYISTNLISITDGQIILDSTKFAKNLRPAMNIGISVSRIGGDVQPKILKKLCGSIKLQLAKYDEYEELAKFSSDLSDEMQIILNSGRLINKILIQKDKNPTPLWLQILILYSVVHNYIQDYSLAFEQSLAQYKEHAQEICEGNEDIIKKLITQSMEEICQS